MLKIIYEFEAKKIKKYKFVIALLLATVVAAYSATLDISDPPQDPIYVNVPGPVEYIHVPGPIPDPVICPDPIICPDVIVCPDSIVCPDPIICPGPVEPGPAKAEVEQDIWTGSNDGADTNSDNGDDDEDDDNCGHGFGHGGHGGHGHGHR